MPDEAPPPEPQPAAPPLPEDVDAATLLVNAILSAGGDAFCDDRGNCLVRVPTPQGFETLPLESKRLRHHLVGLGHDLYRRAPRPADVRRVLDLLGAMAVRGERRILYNRFALANEALWIDTGGGHVIRVDASGWRVTSHSPVGFRHLQHQLPLPLPVRGGRVDLLLDLLNLAGDDDRLLALAWLAWCAFPDTVHPILLLVGPPGSAKTTAAVVLRRTLDPSILGAIEAPRRRAELAQVLDQSAIVPLDNISHLTQRETDLLCKAATGGVFPKRKLRTDEDSIFLRLQRSVIMTAVPIPSKAVDFLDRCLRLRLDRPRRRRLEREVLETFEQAAPWILGALLDLVAGAIQVLPSVPVPDEFRLVDFAQWGEAVAIALGHAPGRFVEAYRRNMASVADDAVLADPVANAIRKLAAAGDWAGTCLQLLGVLAAHADPHDRRDWPLSEDALGMRLSILGPVLARVGIRVDRFRGAHPRHERLVSIRAFLADTHNTDEQGVPGVPGVPRRGSGGNGRRPGFGGDGAVVRGLLPPGSRGEA